MGECVIIIMIKRIYIMNIVYRIIATILLQVTNVKKHKSKREINGIINKKSKMIDCCDK
jgi:hypothetical protein